MPTSNHVTVTLAGPEIPAFGEGVVTFVLADAELVSKLANDWDEWAPTLPAPVLSLMRDLETLRGLAADAAAEKPATMTAPAEWFRKRAYDGVLGERDRLAELPIATRRPAPEPGDTTPRPPIAEQVKAAAWRLSVLSRVLDQVGWPERADRDELAPDVQTMRDVAQALVDTADLIA